MDNDTNVVELATDLTIAWLGNPNTRSTAADVPAFLQSMHEAVTKLTSEAAPAAEEQATQHTPAVTARKSLASPDHIISMIDGKPYRTLRRHLSKHGLTPADYRCRYGLKADYPMVAASYSEARRAMAKTIGLGRKPGQKAAQASEIKPAAKTTRARSPEGADKRRVSVADPAAARRQDQPR